MKDVRFVFVDFLFTCCTGSSLLSIASSGIGLLSPLKINQLAVTE
ncbi:hypothetical protein [Vibrio splendidus]|nr:hypothetical protein [Vibrio splendidus]